MRTIPLMPETEALARRLVWFATADEALSDTVRFVAYALARGTHVDMTGLCRFLTDDDFWEVLYGAPTGMIDARSWVYWNSKFGRYPAPPKPVRRFGKVTDILFLGRRKILRLKRRAAIRESSLARQWRRMRRAMKRARTSHF